MKEGTFFLAVLLLWVVTSSSVQASTDYRCLKLCLAQGEIYYKCKPQCGFGQEEIKENQEMLVKTPLPWHESLLQKDKPLSTKNQEKDYQCLKRCLHEGMQYGFCTMQCEKR